MKHKMMIFLFFYFLYINEMFIDVLFAMILIGF